MRKSTVEQLQHVKPAANEVAQNCSMSAVVLL